jgi:serine/threonine-protein kinase
MALLQANETLAEKYRVDALLGEGGMGDVYAATNLWTHRHVAIKVLHAEWNASP